jgi:translocation and assembly module TamB
VVLVLAGIIVALVLVLALFVNTAIGHRTVAALVEPLTGGRVAVEGLSGQIPYALRIRRLELRDATGPWLIIDNAAVEGSPFSLLLRNRADISRFAADRVHLIRLPAEEGGGRSSSLAVDVRELQIARLETDAAVSRTPASLELRGSIRYASLEEWNADLTANRLDARGLYRVRASLDDGAFTGAADIEEPPAGLLAGLLGLNDIGAIELHAMGSGPREANAVRVTLSAGPMRASAGGVIDLIARTGEIDFMAEAPEMALRPDLAWQSLSAEGHLRGALDGPAVDADLDLRNLRAQAVAVAAATANVSGQTGALDFSASLTGLRLPGSEPDLFARAPISARGTLDLQSPARRFSVSLSHPLLSMDAQGTAGAARRAQAHVVVPRLAPFAERARLDLEGSADLMATIEQTGDDIRVDANGAVSATRGEGPLPGLIGSNARLAVSATISGTDIAISEARLVGTAATTQVSGRLRNGDLQLNGSLGLTDLSLLTPRLIGDLSTQVKARGPWETARIEATALGNIGTPSIEKQQINISLDAIGLPRPESGTFDVQGHFDDAPLLLNGRLAREQRDFRVTIERGTWKSLEARADITIPDSGDVSGAATVRIAQLGDIASVVDASVEGDLQAEIDFRLRDGETSADIDAQAQNLGYAGVTVRRLATDVALDAKGARVNARASEIAFQDTSAREAAINGRIDEPFDNPSLALMVDAAGLTAGRFSGDAKAQIDGRRDATLGVRLDWNPRDDAGNDAKLSTTGTLDLPRQRILFRSLQANYRGQTATLEQPFTLSFGPQVALDRAVLRIADGRMSVGGSISPRLQVRATAENVLAAALVPLVPELSGEGRLSGVVDLSGTIADPEGTISMQGRGLRAREVSSVLMPASLDARATLREGTLALNAELSAGASLQLAVTGDVSLRPEPALDLDLDGQGELSILNPLLSAGGRNLQGRVALDMSVEGTFDTPRLSGRATLSQGEIQDVQRSLRIQDIAMTAEGTAQEVRVTQFSGRAGDGTITGDGSIDLSDSTIPVSFTLTAENARPIAGDRFAATVDAALRVTGAVRSELVVAGNINVTRGEITLPERVPPSVVVLDVRRPGQIAAMAEDAASFADIRYDLTITTRGGVSVRGRGIEAEVAGTSSIRGSADAPAITGGFDLRRGMFTVAGRTFDLTSGRVAFDGTSIGDRIDPTLELAAEMSSAGITAKIAVTGYASEPRIVLSSTPTMPQDEILARILFQRSAAQLSPIQLAQLAETAVSLASGGSGFDPLGALGRSIGLSRLSVGSTGGPMPETTVEAGRYVLGNVYIGATQGLEGGTQAQVQVELRNRLKIVGTVNTGSSAAVAQGAKQRESGSSIGLSYEFEY